ncbi:PREDICTED: tctex1 domain-containing protein 2-like [Dinoponera quadriceps]|uniref:Tctex1 domain-containing protein 2-like n=1 Tax=Dinoponera quadriceps TaxID=609295 RepID=A0A6P3X7C9_DINQU|nr:PREDICTED: tctex1 domain-containing protein 2-like [Dinoponera quadriceps]
MNKPQIKQDNPEPMPKNRHSITPPTRLSKLQVDNAERRKTLSKFSMIGINGSPMFFHRRGDRLKMPKYQNTFRLLPFKPFHALAVDKIVRDVMETKLLAITSYEPDHASKLCLEIAADVLKAVEKKDYDRRKLVVQVNIIQRYRQGICAAFQCLWDVEHDNYSYHVSENDHVHAWCCVFGIYYD